MALFTTLHIVAFSFRPLIGYFIRTNDVNGSIRVLSGYVAGAMIKRSVPVKRQSRDWDSSFYEKSMYYLSWVGIKIAFINNGLSQPSWTFLTSRVEFLIILKWDSKSFMFRTLPVSYLYIFKESTYYAREPTEKYLKLGSRFTWFFQKSAEWQYVTSIEK